MYGFPDRLHLLHSCPLFVVPVTLLTSKNIYFFATQLQIAGILAGTDSFPFLPYLGGIHLSILCTCLISSRCFVHSIKMLCRLCSFEPFTYVNHQVTQTRILFKIKWDLWASPPGYYQIGGCTYECHVMNQTWTYFVCMHLGRQNWKTR